MAKKRKGDSKDEAYKLIKDMMYYKELSPGQSIVYSDLSEKLNMSTTPIIQALSRLEDNDIVTYKPNKGYSVGLLNESEIRELYGAREALEIYILEDVLKNATPSKINKIRKKFREYKNVQELRFLLVIDSQFHLSISELSGHKLINKMLNNLLEQQCIKFRLEYLTEGRLIDVVKEHRAILSAIEQKDLEKAIDMVKKHNKNTVNSILASAYRKEPSVALKKLKSSR